MNRLLVIFGCALFLSVAVPGSSAAAGIKFWHKHKKDPNTSTTAPAKTRKKSIFHREKTSREELARNEATYGQLGPKSVGYWHPQPGPAGAGAN